MPAEEGGTSRNMSGINKINSEVSTPAAPHSEHNTQGRAERKGTRLLVQIQDWRAGRMAETEPWLQTDAPPPQDFWLKQWLVLCFGPRLIPKDAAQARHSEHSSFPNRKRLVVALLVALALVVMGLLLLWNYKCIMVWHLCREDGDFSGLPTFGNG